MPSKHITDLPQIITDRIYSLLTPTSRGAFSRAFTELGQHASFKKSDMQSARPWDLIFKDETWLQKVVDMYNEYPTTKSPVPTLLGSDLLKLYYNGSSRCTVYLALLVSDGPGDVRYVREALFSSFRDQNYEFNEKTDEIWFKELNIILHIGDAIRSSEWISMSDPSRLFQRHKRAPRTAALYPGDDHLYQMGREGIGGIVNFSMRKKKHVRYMCSVRLRFGSGEPVYRVFQAVEKPFKLVHNTFAGTSRDPPQIKDWRLARHNEMEWWP